MTLFTSAAVLTVAAALTAGTLLILATRLCDMVATRLALRELQGRCVSGGFHLALLLLLPIAGILTDQFGARSVLATGSLLAAVAIAVLATARGYLGAMVGALLLGNSTACLWTASVVLMPAGFGLAHPAAALNAGFVFLGLGLLFGPWLPETLLLNFDGRRTLGVFALLMLLPALLAAVTEVEARVALDPAGGELDLLHRPEFWLLALALFLCLPVEQALTTWVLRYLAESGHAERRLAWLSISFGLAFLAGRLAMALAWDRGWFRPTIGPWLVLALALTAGVALGNLTGARGRRGPVLALLCVGVLLGPLTPTVLGLLFERFPPGGWGTAFGGAMLIGSLGPHLVLPLLAGYARRVTTYQTLWLHVIGLLLVALLMLALAMARTLRV